MVMRHDGGGARRTAGTTKPTSSTSPGFNPGGLYRNGVAPGQNVNMGAVYKSGIAPGPSNSGLPKPPAPGTMGTRPLAPPAPAAPRYTPGSQVSPGMTGSYSAAPIAPMSEIAPAPMPGDDEWKAQDSAYITETGGINAELENLLNMLKQQRGNYDADFGESMDNLGWEGDPLGEGSWDTDDTLGAYGQAYKGQQEDFAGRGMLTSSFFGNANSELNNRFNEQRNDMLGNRQRQMGAWDMEQTQGQSRAQQALAQAMASSFARRAAQYGL